LCCGPCRQLGQPTPVWLLYTRGVLNLSAEASAALAERLGTESVAWITTVAADGQPQSSPVWFWWDGSEFLVYAQPRSWKVRNIRANPKVSLHLNSDREGGQVATFEGSARICEGRPPAHEVDAYLAKYREGIAGIGMTPEQMGAEYPTALRITPARIRVY
jgi:PPOX class probable F420-dependent enzyme